jgi:hypothetical protein
MAVGVQRQQAFETYAAGHLRHLYSIAVAIASAMTVEAATSLTKSTTALALKACESATGTAASRSITIRTAFRAQGTGNPL